MVSLVMVVRDILVDRASQVALAEWNQSMQAFELDGPHEPFCMRVTVRSADGRLDNVDTRGAQERDHRAAPFSIAIANQHRARVENTVDVVGQMPHGLQHEGFVWMRRGTNDVHPPGLQLHQTGCRYYAARWRDGPWLLRSSKGFKKERSHDH